MYKSHLDFENVNKLVNFQKKPVQGDFRVSEYEFEIISKY